MKTKSIVSIISMLLIIGTACAVSGATTNPVQSMDRSVPDPNQTTLTLSGQGLLTCPEGDGATRVLTVTIRDATGSPLMNFPASSVVISLAAQAGTIWYGAFSLAATPMDSMSNANGEIRYSLFASSSIVGAVRISATILGISIVDTETLTCNSIDLNADGALSLPDISMFASIYFGGIYDYRGDFSWDGAISLPDISIFSTHYF